MDILSDQKSNVPIQPHVELPEIPLPEIDNEMQDSYDDWMDGKSISDICIKKTRRRERVVNHLCDMILLG